MNHPFSVSNPQPNDQSLVKDLLLLARGSTRFVVNSPIFVRPPLGPSSGLFNRRPEILIRFGIDFLKRRCPIDDFPVRPHHEQVAVGHPGLAGQGSVFLADGRPLSLANRNGYSVSLAHEASAVSGSALMAMRTTLDHS